MSADEKLLHGAAVRQHVAGLMLEAAIHEASGRPQSAAADRLAHYAAVLEAGPVGAGLGWDTALSEAEPFFARAAQDLLGGWIEHGCEHIRRAVQR